MEKITTTRFPGKCVRCGKGIPAGERAVWMGKGSGIRHHPTCPGNDSPVTIEKPKEEIGNNDFTHTIDYPKLVAEWRRFTEKPQGYYVNRFNDSAANALYQHQSNERFVGCTRGEFNEWINHGYRVPGLDEVSSLIPAKPRRRLRHFEEGDELHVDLAWAGDDKPFSEWEKRAGKPGLTVEINTEFHSDYPSTVIAQYLRWIARALQTLDENGVDMEVSVVMNVLWWNDNSREKTFIRVRKPGEASDFANWSAMFSPGGFRMLGIHAAGITRDGHGGQVDSGYGSPLDYGKWTVDYDDERNIVVFGNDQNTRSFPEMEMTEKLVAILSELTG